jgi:ubiE/COQ5 methyltransferase family
VAVDVADQVIGDVSHLHAVAADLDRVLLVTKIHVSKPNPPVLMSAVGCAGEVRACRPFEGLSRVADLAPQVPWPPWAPAALTVDGHCALLARARTCHIECVRIELRWGGDTNQDRWARWVLQRRDAGDVQVRQHGAALLAGYRDGVLDRAAVTDGDVLLDVGAGDGLIGFAALDRVGLGGQVVFSDISADLLAECRRRGAGGARSSLAVCLANGLEKGGTVVLPVG